ncbi:MAG TPA: hypothetical protein VN030_01645, partial [Cellvibrio sp.]|nr:hypothetical protein [Cellvibrio sp.]
MKYEYLLIAFALSICANAKAEWFLRGTHNSWTSSQMEAAGSNSLQLTSVVFNSAGGIKFDRFGDWKESYGINGGNIPVAAGTWDIKFFTDTKTWSISAPQAAANYHIRGTFNAWQEGTLLNRIGSSDNYERCVNFSGGDSNGGPRFKIDPNGAWGDAIPAADFAVSAGWVKINFNSTSKAISVQQNQPAECATTISSTAAFSSVNNSIANSSTAPGIPYHLRGTFNAWQEGALLNRIGSSDNYERCVNFSGGDSNGGPRFKIDPNGAWGDALPAADFVVTAGWIKINFNSTNKTITVQQNQLAECATTTSSIVALSSANNSIANSSVTPGTPYHLRGTFNAWQEGTLLNRIGSSDNYERCVNFSGGDSNGGPRFKIDPNGAWGDALPTSDFLVSAGWVKISFNSSSKMINVQQNLSANCAPVSSTAASSSLSSAAAGSSIATSTPY